jgi:predicted N-formylglutamate amidohydrolase
MPRPILLVADHASNAVPPELGDLGVPAAAMAEHIAWDIGTADLAQGLSDQLDAPAILAPWSRLVIDLNRPADHPGLIVEASDGVAIPANQGLTLAERTRRLHAYHAPHHAAIDAALAGLDQPLVVALHSFTPVMHGFVRPWQVGLLWNREAALSLAAAAWLAEAEPSFAIGLNQPYSGRRLNYTMDRHAEAHGRPYLSLEIRQDLIDSADGVAAWTDRLAALLGVMAAR